jgi:hypothetical protein
MKVNHNAAMEKHDEAKAGDKFPSIACILLLYSHSLCVFVSSLACAFALSCAICILLAISLLLFASLRCLHPALFASCVVCIFDTGILF